MENKDFIILILMILLAIGCIFFIRLDWKRYGFLFVTSLLSANLLCYVFVYSGLYSFPNDFLHDGFPIPYGLISTLFPFIAMFGVRFSPEKWKWKIPFYWAIVHLGVLGEVILKGTSFFEFKAKWDLWDSYTLWWLYYLLFELLGGKIIPGYLRRPINDDSFRYGKWAWILFHIIVITTIFLAGVYVGVTVFNK